MKPRYFSFPVLSLLLAAPPALGANAVVGDGSPGGCSESHLDVAIATAHAGGGTITFDCGPDPIVITLTAAKTITAFVVFDGDNKVTLSGGGTTRHFVVAAAAVATMREISLVDGIAAGGGAVVVEPGGDLELDRAVLANNTSTASGGAVLASGGVVHALWSTFAGNCAAGDGGAIAAVGGRVDLSRTILTNNTALGHGGALDVANTTQLAVFGSSFDHNTAGGDGGALRATSTSGFLEVSSFVLNVAAGQGGAVLLQTGSGVSLSRDTVADNVAAEGGGFFIAAGSSSVQRESTFSGNSASDPVAKGGAIANLGSLQLENTTISGNSSAGSGGGVHNEGALTLRMTTIANNQAVAGGGVRTVGLGSTLHARNVIWASNTASDSGDQCSIESGAGTDIAASLWSGISCGELATNGNKPETDAQILPLGFSCPVGIPEELTRSHNLSPSSPAIDAGIPLAGGNTFMDQRGVLRPQGNGTNDMGSVEHTAGGCPWFFADGFESGNTWAWSNTVP
jgi:predicted outer membrane repeat protein